MLQRFQAASRICLAGRDASHTEENEDRNLAASFPCLGKASFDWNAYAQGSVKNAILLARLALFYVRVHGFAPSLSGFGPKLDPSWTQVFRLHPYSETNSLGTPAAFGFFFLSPKEAGDLGKGATSPPSQQMLSRVFVIFVLYKSDNSI